MKLRSTPKVRCVNRVIELESTRKIVSFRQALRFAATASINQLWTEQHEVLRSYTAYLIAFDCSNAR